MSDIESPTPPPSLTYHRRVAALQRDKIAAVAATPPYEVKEVGIPKVDKNGEVLLVNGMPSIVDQRVLLRDLVASEWDDKIKAYEDSYPGFKGERPSCVTV